MLPADGFLRPYYEDATVTLYHGDCKAILPTLGRVDAVITDPPYSDHVHAKSRAGSRKMSRDPDRPSSYSRTKELGFAALSPELRASVAEQFAQLARRWVLVFSDVESDHLWRSELTSAGLEYVRTGFWEKVGATPQFTGDRPATPAEAITIARSRDYALAAVLARLDPADQQIVHLALEDAASGREESPFGKIVMAHPKGRKRWNGGGSHAMFRFNIALNRDGRSPRHHPTEKSLPLMSRLVELFTEPGETVLDAFAGSGTTLRAAKDLGRKAIGIEIEEKWCEVAALRLSQEAIFGPAALRESQPEMFSIPAPSTVGDGT